MSEAKVLSDKQKRAALSNSMKKKKAPLRNVYVHPRNEHWPVLTADDEKILTDLIRGLFPALRGSKISKCNDKAESTVSKRKRNFASLCEEDSSILQEVDNIRSQIVIGLREVIVAIERGELKCLLLAKEVDPPFLDHIVGNLAAASNVPFATISNFRQLLEEFLGFKSWCVGFKEFSSGYFAPIYEKVLSLNNRTEISNFSAGSQLTSEYCSDSSSKGRKLTPNPISLTNVHLYRSDKSKRVFVPKSASVEANSTSTSFLQFSKDDSGSETHPQGTHSLSHSQPRSSVDPSKTLQPQRYFQKVQLLPLQVKRFQGNPNKHTWRKDLRNRRKETQQRK